MDFVLRTIGWILFAWSIPNLIGIGIFNGELIKSSFIKGYEADRKKGWRAHGFSMIFIFAGALTLWYHLVFIWTA